MRLFGSWGGKGELCATGGLVALETRTQKKQLYYYDRSNTPLPGTTVPRFCNMCVVYLGLRGVFFFSLFPVFERLDEFVIRLAVVDSTMTFAREG